MNIRGIDIALHADEDLSNHIRREQDFFEPDILDYLRDKHNIQDMIVDIGANIGNHSIYFANFLSYTNIICFEPIPENFELLKINMAPYGKKIDLINIALSNESHIMRMIADRRNMGASRIEPEGNVYVKAMTLDQLHLRNVTLMKIDVESHEPEVILGAKDTIARCHPLILIEDWYMEYAKLLPDYKLEQGWPEHKTYLYEWIT